MCGAVRYECIEEPVMSANCYSRDCRRETGGATAPVLMLAKPGVLTRGQEIDRVPASPRESG
jgi:hypothetical protein